MPSREVQGLGEVLKDPIGAFLKRHPVEAGDTSSFVLKGIQAEHRAEMLGEAYKDLQADVKEGKTGRGVEEKQKFVAALYGDPKTRDAYLVYWKKYKDERRVVNGTYEQYKVLKRDLDRLEKEYDGMSRTLFGHRAERTSAVDKMLYQKVKSDLEAKRKEEEKILDHFPKLAARVSHDRLAEYNRELTEDSFMWFPSRRKILERLEDAALSGRPVLFLGESGTGKTSLVTSAAKNLTGELPFKSQGGPSTRLQDSLATKGLKGDVSCLEYQPLGQALTGKETNLDAGPSHDGGIYFDDEFNNRPKDVQMEIIKAVSGVRPGKKARLPLIGEVDVRSKYQFVAAGNPPSDRYDREPMDPAVRREFGTAIHVDYPEQTLENPELYEGMLAALMDKNNRLRFALSELEPAVEKDANGREKGKIVAGGRKERTFVDDPQVGGALWRFALALNELYKSFSYKETVLNDKGVGQYLSQFVLDPGVMFGWLRNAVEQGYQGSLEKYLNDKIEDKLSEAGLPKEDLALAREFFEHFGLLQKWTKEKERTLVFSNLTPEQIGLLSPRVKYLRAEEASEFGATAVIGGKPIQYRREGLPEAPVGMERVEKAGGRVFKKEWTWTVLGTTKASELVIHSDDATGEKDRLISKEDFLPWKEKEAPKPPEPESKSSFTRAREIFGKDFFGPEAVERAFGFKPEKIPPIPFSEAELKRAKELGQMLVLRVDKMPDGKSLSMEAMRKALEDKWAKANKGGVFNTVDGWRQQVTGDDYFVKEAPRSGWALVSKDLVPDSTNKNYIDQTDVLIAHLKTVLFKNASLPDVYQKAIKEFESQKTGLTAIITSDWETCAKRLSELSITKLCRQTLPEAMYDLLLHHDATNDRLLPSTYTWTGSLSQRGRLVDVGRFAGRGVDGSHWNPVSADGRLGVSFSRRV